MNWAKKQRDNTLLRQACFVIRLFFGSYFYIIIEHCSMEKQKHRLPYLKKIIYIYIYIYIINSRSFWLIKKFSLSVPYEIYGEQYGEYARNIRDFIVIRKFVSPFLT